MFYFELILCVKCALMNHLSIKQSRQETPSEEINAEQNPLLVMEILEPTQYTSDNNRNEDTLIYKQPNIKR